MSEYQHINLMELQAREKLGMSDDWHAYYFARMPPMGQAMYFEIQGAVAPPFKSGPRKGRLNWSKRDKATDKTVYLPVAEIKAWEQGWESKTGLCARCTGNGRLPWSWSKDKGTSYRPCPHCLGTGKRQEKGDT